ncbi:hypothetical protein C1645_733262 [Glomus cerebriforme]|uniref:Mediator complex subunit 8 n=1 Tax=Glomus cerebriforme TaxID=658196 RepID=A0A397TGN5_9GLOM|nr:hypothetical protein C1645_733262 [Glomus cerebriforme]
MTQQQRMNYTGGITQNVTNIDHIEVVRSRMIQVNDAQSEFLANLSVSEDPSWINFLNKFNTFLSKHTGLSNTFIDSTLRKIMLYPKEAPPVELEQIFNTLLRTKQIPEIEILEQEIKQEISLQENLLNLELEIKKNLNDIDDDSKWDKLFDEWEKRYKEHDFIALSSSQICENIFGDINLKNRLSDSIDFDKDLHDDVENIEDLTMEKVLAFMSSGIQEGKGPSK